MRPVLHGLGVRVRALRVACRLLLRPALSLTSSSSVAICSSFCRSCAPGCSACSRCACRSATSASRLLRAWVARAA